MKKRKKRKFGFFDFKKIKRKMKIRKTMTNKELIKKMNAHNTESKLKIN